MNSKFEDIQEMEKAALKTTIIGSGTAARSLLVR